MYDKKRKIEYFDESELRDAIATVIGDENIARIYANSASKLWASEVVARTKYEKGLITKKELEELRDAYWQHANNHSQKLALNMESAGKARPGMDKDGSLACHHIVSWSHPRAARSRDMMKAVGLDIDHHANGVYLPRFKRHIPHKDYPALAIAHSQIHTKEYYFNVETLLESTLAEGLGRDGVIETLEDIAHDLEQGDFPIKERLNSIS